MKTKVGAGRWKDAREERGRTRTDGRDGAYPLNHILNAEAYTTRSTLYYIYGEFN